MTGPFQNPFWTLSKPRVLSSECTNDILYNRFRSFLLCRSWGVSLRRGQLGNHPSEGLTGPYNSVSSVSPTVF